MARSTQRHRSPQPSESSTAMENAVTARVASSSSLKDLGTDSDPDNRERPVREKLQKTSIDTLPSEATSKDRTMSDVEDENENPVVTAEGSEASSSENTSRGRVRRKRSYEDMEAADGSLNKAEKHSRKKSRDMNSPRHNPSTDSSHVPSEAIAEEVHERNTSNLQSSTESNGTAKEPAVKDVQSLVNGEGSRHATPPFDISKDSIVSPKNKRNRDQFLRDSAEGRVVSSEEDKQAAGPAEDDDTDPPQTKTAEEPKPKRQRDSGSPQPPTEDGTGSDKKALSGGFSNTSTTSPFGALSGSKSPKTQPQASSSAFAASGFGALSSSSTSPFSTLSSEQPAKSPFSTLAEKKNPPTFTSTASSTSVFGAALTSNDKSPFVSAGASSGFGALGKGFSGAANGGRLTTFAGGTGPSITGLGGKPAKPFGAQPDDDEDEEGSGAEEEDIDAKSPEEDKKDPRFHEQEISTGEEAEDEVFKCRAKLYNYAKVSETSDKKEWKERGVGDLKLLASKGYFEASSEPIKGRFVMRADKSHRLLLNSPILKNGNYGTTDGKIPKNGSMLFMGTIDEKPVELLQIKMKPVNAEDLWKQITELQKDM